MRRTVPHLGCKVDGPTTQQQHFARSTLCRLCIALQTKGRPFVVLLGFGSWRKWRLRLNNEFSQPLAGSADLKDTHVRPQGDSPSPWSQESWIKILVTKSLGFSPWSAARLIGGCQKVFQLTVLQAVPSVWRLVVQTQCRIYNCWLQGTAVVNTRGRSGPSCLFFPRASVLPRLKRKVKQKGREGCPRHCPWGGKKGKLSEKMSN